MGTTGRGAFKEEVEALNSAMWGCASRRARASVTTDARRPSLTLMVALLLATSIAVPTAAWASSGDAVRGANLGSATKCLRKKGLKVITDQGKLDMTITLGADTPKGIEVKALGEIFFMASKANAGAARDVLLSNRARELPNGTAKARGRFVVVYFSTPSAKDEQTVNKCLG
jgi:hypothetical protein